MLTFHGCEKDLAGALGSHLEVKLLLQERDCGKTKNDRRSSGGTLRQKKTWLNLIGASISINQHQSASICINRHQSASISINQNQSASINKKNQSASIHDNVLMSLSNKKNTQTFIYWYKSSTSYLVKFL